MIVCIVRKKKRQNNSFYHESKQLEYGAGGNIYMTTGTDVDNLQLGSLRRKASPLPDVVHPDKVKSPMENRKHGTVSSSKSKNRSVDSNLVNLAGKTPTLQKQAWEQMKMRQDQQLSDEEDEEDEFLDDESPESGVVSGGPPELPHPPAYLLNSNGGDEGHYVNAPFSDRNMDSESYQDIIEGYHSGDNMDDYVEEADFELRVPPSGNEQNTYISYDPVT